jgi:tetratricopeptide (TPR) repeat protein
LGGTKLEGRHLSTSEVARILGLGEAQVRTLARSGLCSSARRGRRYAFDFQDLVSLRTAKGLLEQRVPAARVRRVLNQLGDQLGGEDRPLSGLRIFADGRDVAVRDGHTLWNPETGQTLLDFQVDELAQRVRELRAVDKDEPSDAALQARRAFEQALELEDEDPAAAGEAYVRALELDPDLVDAYVNLARIVHEDGDATSAARLYEKAIELSPDDPIVHFNLGLALEDTEGIAPAAAHYARALQLDPDFADAHYNLAGIYEKQGRETDALRHYGAYRKLTDA